MVCGEGISLPYIWRKGELNIMNTVLDVLVDINNGILAHNMVETYFSYRLVYFINENRKSEKHYIDTRYDGLRKTLENIIRGNLTTTNNIVVAQTTVRKSGETVSLLSRPYSFSLSEYFRKVCDEKTENCISDYRRRRM